jgi:hypothetical protein
MRTVCAALLLAGLSAFAVGCKKRAAQTADSPEPAAAPAPTLNPPPAVGKRGAFTVGKSTTFVTGPVDATGHIDYVAAFNERLSNGVRPENNANVAIWKILGPNPPGGGKFPPGFFEKMGMQPPPAAGDYFIGLRAYCDRHAPGQANAVAEAMGKFSNRPWTTEQNAVVAGWLRSNEKPLNAIRDAVKKTGYYNPLLPEKAEKGLATTLHPGLFACRELTGALTDRAMLYLGQSNAAEAWQDLIACHRLARQVARGGTLVEGLVSLAIEQIVCRAEVAFLDRARPDAKTVENCLRDLRALPPQPFVADQLNGERFWLLDTLMQCDKHGASQLSLYGADFQHGLRDEDLNGIDWNPALEVMNKGCDRLIAAFREPDRAARIRKLSEIEAEGRTRNTQFVSGTGATVLKTAGSVGERGRMFGEMLFSTTIPNLRTVFDAADCAQQTFDTVAVAYALAWYQRVNGRYPEALAQLAPTYLKTVPGDLFSGKGLIYQPNPNGFVLYSVGMNGADDGGRGYDSQPPGDDIVVRITPGKAVRRRGYAREGGCDTVTARRPCQCPSPSSFPRSRSGTSRWRRSHT